MQPKRLIYDLDFNELSQVFQEWTEPAYRATQVWQGIYQQLWNSPEQFTTLPAALRARLDENFRFQSMSPARTIQSSDGETVKTLLLFADQFSVEAVLMRYADRRTLCISSQSGCAMGCVFCATGQMGFGRNLSSGEIVEQILYYARQLRSEDDRVTNVVMMGMGEPFHNYAATLKAIDTLNDSRGMNLGERRFTISTVGLVPKIRQFADEQRQINLAISLHAANDEERSAVLPVNRRYPLQDLLDACRYYVEKTNRRITFEWALILDVNDTPAHAKELAHLLKGLLCHVNVIPLNPTQQFGGKATTRERAQRFCAELEKAGIPCTIRIRRGIDIQAGCGQLASETAQRRRPSTHDMI
ncbi:MAG: 23S rRNA (adenine(2503)-C(2))-methyltransferase RlmN [Chloroflexi bacterium]|nr:23S rRNA (adenine(2503)-C(2))-methyltransferase RlmN [Anaerolineaceae bacterium]NMB88977.1 23S rRNA (adenine(2503)-C(2))-methyltransferase RlmN [Chloroflexota bacterium]